jgi:hypothetical protein
LSGPSTHGEPRRGAATPPVLQVFDVSLGEQFPTRFPHLRKTHGFVAEWRPSSTGVFVSHFVSVGRALVFRDNYRDAAPPGFIVTFIVTPLRAPYWHAGF